MMSFGLAVGATDDEASLMRLKQPVANSKHHELSRVENSAIDCSSWSVIGHCVRPKNVMNYAYSTANHCWMIFCRGFKRPKISLRLKRTSEERLSTVLINGHTLQIFFSMGV